MMKLQGKIICLTDDLWKAIDLSRGEVPRQAFIEEMLRKAQPIEKAARKHRIKFGPRPQVGKYDRGK